MKSSINKFDYPTAASQTYKMYKQEKPKHDEQKQKQSYKQFVKEQRDIERMKAKQEQQRKLEAERRENKKKIQQEIENKKRQLEELERARNMAMEAEKKSQELAIIRQEQERVMKIEQDRKAKQNEFNAQNRFMEALKRLEMDNYVKDKKDREAQMRRKAAEETEKAQRIKAIKYRQTIEEKERQMVPEEKRTFDQYKQTLGRTAYNKNVDYSKTYLHNPMIIVPETSPQQSAMERAQNFNNRQRELSEQKRQKQQQNRRISMQRGQIAMDKLKLQKQFEEYQREAQAKAIEYNKQRIELGKKNQYVGMKPVTLAQMEANKKQRGEQQFEQMFFGGSNPQWFDRPANKYQIMGARLGNTEESKVSQIPMKKNKKIPKSLGSLQPAISESHYSFEQGSLNELTTVKKNGDDRFTGLESNGLNPIKQYQERQQYSEDRGQMHETNKKEELSYSESEDSFV